jgi:hypothetical protein
MPQKSAHAELPASEALAESGQTGWCFKSAVDQRVCMTFMSWDRAKSVALVSFSAEVTYDESL